MNERTLYRTCVIILQSLSLIPGYFGIFDGMLNSFESNTPTNRYSFELFAAPQGKAFIRTEYSSYNRGTREAQDWNTFYKTINGEESIILGEGMSYRDEYVQRYFQGFNVYHFHDTSSKSPLKKMANISDNRFFRQNGENLSAFLYFLQEKHPKVLKKIDKVVHSVAPFFDYFILKPDRIKEELIQLEWKEVGLERYQNARNLSDGTLRFIALATLLLQPDPPKTILIDEPELGLHPSAINKLAGLVKKASAKSQVILSTQSVNLVNNFDPEDIVTVDRVGNESVFKRLDPEKLEDWLNDYGLGDLWFKSVIGGQP